MQNIWMGGNYIVDICINMHHQTLVAVVGITSFVFIVYFVFKFIGKN